MRWHLVPVGLSILEKMNEEQLKLLPVRLGRDRTGLHQEMWAASVAAVSAERASLAEAFWLAQPGTERVLFLASDTDRGKCAAQLNALALAASFEETTSAQPTFYSSGSPLVVVIEDLNPKNDERFRLGMANLARALSTVANDAENGDQVVVHLSGGYKATIPYMVVLTEILSAVLSEKGVYDLRALIRWEGTEGHLDVPLRQVDLAQLRRELGGDLPDGAHDQYGDGFLYTGAYAGAKVPQERLSSLGAAVAAML